MCLENGEEIPEEATGNDQDPQQPLEDKDKFQYGPCKEGDKECESYHSRAINRKSLSLVSP